MAGAVVGDEAAPPGSCIKKKKAARLNRAASDLASECFDERAGLHVEGPWRGSACHRLGEEAWHECLMGFWLRFAISNNNLYTDYC